ncbi:hypothetical protein [Enterococcus faecium]|uniref:hypothetical protein n=1 Tax=Enterococcus faecium TaxID=1352 RepID=UPI0031018BD6
MTWNKQKRFEALLTGTKADRPIVSGWHHFLDKEQTSADLAEATVEFATEPIKKLDFSMEQFNRMLCVSVFFKLIIA